MSAPASTLDKVAIAARALGAVGVLVIAGRFAYVSAVAATAPAPSAAPSDSTPPGRGTERAPIANRSGGEPRPGKGKVVRVTAMITLAPDQSEIFIDDARVGRTPYMGDVECEIGKRVRVKLVPPKGATVEFDRACDSKDLEITKAP